MGKKSRLKRQRDNGTASAQPGSYSRVMRFLAGEKLRALHDTYRASDRPVKRGDGSWIVGPAARDLGRITYDLAKDQWLPPLDAHRDLARARVVVIPHGLVGSIETDVDAANDWVVGLPIPFPYTFLDFQGDVVGSDRRTLLGVLLAGDADQWTGWAFIHDPSGPAAMWCNRLRPSKPGEKTLSFDGDPDDEDAVRAWECYVGAELGYWPTSVALAVLSAANVRVEETAGPSRGHQAHGVPHYEVIIRPTSRSASGPPPGTSPEWSHRWEVRGHFKHYGPDTRLFQASPPEKVLHLHGRGECVRIWCPPYIKGPDDKPLIPKRRKVVPTIAEVVMP